MNEHALFETFCAAKRIADIPYANSYFTPEVGGFLPWLEDRRSEAVNPFYSQTTSGLFLEMSYDLPAKIWTPWGYWGCWGSGRVNHFSTGEFLSHLTLKVHEKLKIVDIGGLGPVYKIFAVEGASLIEPVVREHSDYLDYQSAKTGWETMQKQFDKSA